MDLARQAGSCIQCLAGRFFQDQHCGAATECNVDDFRFRNATLECPDGCFLTTLDRTHEVCAQCMAGTSDVDRDWRTACEECADGTTPSPFVGGRGECSGCVSGKEVVGTGSCQPCARGKHDSDCDPVTPCVLCAAGRYMDEVSVQRHQPLPLLLLLTASDNCPVLLSGTKQRNHVQGMPLGCRGCAARG